MSTEPEGSAAGRKSLFAAASVYWLGHALNAAIAFLLLPVLTRYLSPAEYGLLAMFTLVTSIADPIVGLNLHAAVTRRYFDLDQTGIARYVGTCLLLLVPSTAAALLLSLLLSGPLGRATLLPAVWVIGAIGLAPLNAVANTALALFQAQARPWTYTALSLLRALGGAGLSLWLVVGVGLGWEGRAGGVLLAAALLAPVSLILMARRGLFTPAWEPAAARHALGYGVPLIPHGLGGIAMTMTDRLLLAHMVGLASAGLYSIGYQVGFVVTMLQDGFNKAWVPWLFARLKQADEAEKRRIVRLSYAYSAGLIGLALLLAAVVPPLLDLVVPDAYDGAWQFVLWIALAAAFDGAYKIPANYIFFAEKTHVLAWVTFSAAALNVPLTWWFIRTNGPIGAAQSTALIALVMWLATWLLSTRYYAMPWWAALRAAPARP